MKNPLESFCNWEDKQMAIAATESVPRAMLRGAKVGLAEGAIGSLIGLAILIPVGLIIYATSDKD